jgi:hypothetical protein
VEKTPKKHKLYIYQKRNKTNKATHIEHYQLKKINKIRNLTLVFQIFYPHVSRPFCRGWQRWQLGWHLWRGELKDPCCPFTLVFNQIRYKIIYGGKWSVYIVFINKLYKPVLWENPSRRRNRQKQGRNIKMYPLSGLRVTVQLPFSAKSDKSSRVVYILWVKNNFVCLFVLLGIFVSLYFSLFDWLVCWLIVLKSFSSIHSIFFSRTTSDV